jgi:hypothetical protein
MRYLITTTALLALIVGPVAIAQTGNPPPASAPKSSGPLPAPVGHRQPRAADLPPGATAAEKTDAEDAALDRKIKSICRGC